MHQTRSISHYSSPNINIQKWTSSPLTISKKFHGVIEHCNVPSTILANYVTSFVQLGHKHTQVVWHKMEYLIINEMGLLTENEVILRVIILTKRRRRRKSASSVMHLIFFSFFAVFTFFQKYLWVTVLIDIRNVNFRNLCFLTFQVWFIVHRVTIKSFSYCIASFFPDFVEIFRIWSFLIK